MQTKLGSFLEACTNVAIGYSVAVTANYFILPYYPPPITVTSAAIIGLWFTLIALARSYLIRRWYERRLRK